MADQKWQIQYQVWSLVRIWQGFEWASCFYWLHNDCYGHRPMVTGQGLCPSFIIIVAISTLTISCCRLLSVHLLLLYLRSHSHLHRDREGHFVQTCLQRQKLANLCYGLFDIICNFVRFTSGYRNPLDLAKIRVLCFCTRLKVFPIFQMLTADNIRWNDKFFA